MHTAHKLRPVSFCRIQVAFHLDFEHANIKFMQQKRCALCSCSLSVSLCYVERQHSVILFIIFLLQNASLSCRVLKLELQQRCIYSVNRFSTLMLSYLQLSISPRMSRINCKQSKHKQKYICILINHFNMMTCGINKCEPTRFCMFPWFLCVLINC